MTNLTELWKKGELKLGEHYYFTTIFSPTVHIQNFTRDVISFQDFKETVAEVLAPVPTFDEYEKLLSDQLAKIEGEEINAELDERLKKTQELELELRKENTKLKELLKDARNVLKMVDTYYGDYDSTKGFLIVERIDEVLK